MPHVIIKLWPGKTERQKQKLVESLTSAVTSSLGYGTESVSVSLEEVAPSDWLAKVYGPDIRDKPSLLYKKPGYGPADL
jgi:4-oxalocrotonate tautomerase